MRAQAWAIFSRGSALFQFAGGDCFMSISRFNVGKRIKYILSESFIKDCSNSSSTVQREGLIGIGAYSSGLMESREMKSPLSGRKRIVVPKKLNKPQVTNTRSLSLGYFSVESFLLLACLTASLLFLPLILPPLPPPPAMLLLLPIGILLVLLILAFMHSDMRDVSSYL
ncbi:hypothetical protein KFK09_023518 [Dendrobium nobile]|uniref:ARGOS-like protein n=1 Tax=Dendrobium nobile TaxID=94219 RepID=A0A8T3AC83_DENNO|nr:hypothetical protein KFK09_023518 [Dendrobium nobile]